MLSPEQIESIVRSVLQRMLAGDAAPIPSPGNAASLSKTLVRSLEGTKTTSSLDLQSHSLITLACLPTSLDGFTEIRLADNAVVTPAVRDYLKSKSIQIARVGASKAESIFAKKDSATPVSRPQRIIVAGNASWYQTLKSALCPKQTKLTDPSRDDASALRTIASGLRYGHQAGVMIAVSPHAACWQAARDDKLRPVVVHDWIECREILAELPANLLILSSRRWNSPATANAVRTFFEHLQSS
jgi:hypothetical protein